MSETTHQISFLNWFSASSYKLLCVAIVACILIIVVILFCVGKCPSANIIKKREVEVTAEASPALLKEEAQRRSGHRFSTRRIDSNDRHG
jgi:hypothetical protein